MSDAYALCKTFKNYSAGTRVKLMNYTKARTAFVQVLCEPKEVLEISLDDLVQLRSRTRIVELAKENHKQRYNRKRAEKNNEPIGGE